MSESQRIKIRIYLWRKLCIVTDVFSISLWLCFHLRTTETAAHTININHYVLLQFSRQLRYGYGLRSNNITIQLADFSRSAHGPTSIPAPTATQIGSHLFITSGHDGTQYTNELLFFNLVSLQYEPRHTRGIPPSPRGYHAAALADGRLWVFGGYDGRTAHDDVYMLDLASSAYLSQVTGFHINVN